MRQGLSRLPCTSYFLIYSAMALILGTIYETFVTMDTIVKPKPIILTNMNELLVKGGYKIFDKLRSKNDEQLLLEKYSIIFYYNGIRDIDPRSPVHIVISNTAWLANEIFSLMASKSIAISSPNSWGILVALEICCSINVTCHQIKEPIYEPGFYTSTLTFYGSSMEYLYSGFKMFQEFGIIQKLLEMETFREYLQFQIKRESWANLIGLNEPKPISFGLANQQTN